MSLNDSQTLVAQKISSLVCYAKKNLFLQDLDAIYAENALLDLFGLLEPTDPVEDFNGNIYKDILDPLAEYALNNGLTDEMGLDRFKTRIMGLVTPTPSQCVDNFDKTVFEKGIRYATEEFYNFCFASTYLNKEKLDKNIIWNHQGKFGDLVITINVARPEKDPKEIAAAKAAPQTAYPRCMLCAENLGYAGRIGFPARQTLRYIPIPLNDDSLWYMQYSPYRYFEQHAIFFSEKHEPMGLGESAFLRMAELVKAVPHYFVGSNAPLPIVGGSILSHDHYQGGAKELPFFKSGLVRQFINPKFPGVKFSIVDWYTSAVRLKGTDSQMVCKAASYVNDMWAKYNDESLGIISHTGDTPHNAVTPVFRLERGDLYAELFLRNNRTDEAHPYGIFHPTEDMHHIKKEGIGVIEVMGLFVLPGRLAKIIRELLRYVKGEKTIKDNYQELNDPENVMYPYRDYIVKLVSEYSDNMRDSQNDIANYIGETCEKIISCTAVFKRTQEGLDGFMRFMDYLGCEEIVPDTKNKPDPRRPWISEDASSVVDEEETQEAPVEEVPKKRGRPPKAKEEPVKEEEGQQEPKRRGRPRKNA